MVLLLYCSLYTDYKVIREKILFLIALIKHFSIRACIKSKLQVLLTSVEKSFKKLFLLSFLSRNSDLVF